MRKTLKTYHLPALFVLMLVVASLSTGCMGEVHINDVAPENQEVEQFILRSGETLEKVEKARIVAFETAIELFQSGDIDQNTMNSVIAFNRKYDTAYKSAAKALMGFRKAVDRGESVTRASVEAAISAAQEALKHLEGEI
ncbi:MAG: hypothetical protein BA863_00975 [Desulfovibrio sp. S3730MH75]|nr:MAG: hypothetical protein BA863_00975 [Desulfovibrio sp. S3730MH75]